MHPVHMTVVELVTLALVVVSISFFIGMYTYSRGPARELTTTVDRLERTVDRIELAAQKVADDLTVTSGALRLAAEQREGMVNTLDRMENATHVVADNLADSVSRADATEGPDGAAADAALRTGDTADAIHLRQEAQREQ